MEIGMIVLVLALVAGVFWVQVKIYQWVKREWPLAAKLLLLCWLLNGFWTLWQLRKRFQS